MRAQHDAGGRRVSLDEDCCAIFEAMACCGTTVARLPGLQYQLSALDNVFTAARWFLPAAILQTLIHPHKMSKAISRFDCGHVWKQIV